MNNPFLQAALSHGLTLSEIVRLSNREMLDLVLYLNLLDTLPDVETLSTATFPSIYFRVEDGVERVYGIRKNHEGRLQTVDCPVSELTEAEKIELRPDVSIEIGDCVQDSPVLSHSEVSAAMNMV